MPFILKHMSILTRSLVNRDIYFLMLAMYGHNFHVGSNTRDVNYHSLGSRISTTIYRCLPIKVSANLRLALCQSSFQSKLSSREVNTVSRVDVLDHTDLKACRTTLPRGNLSRGKKVLPYL